MAEIVNYSPSMDMTNKLQQALDCLLKENFTIQDKTLLEKLLTSLHNEDILLKTIPIEIHCKWFTSVLDVFKCQTSTTKDWAIHLFAFALKYLSILVKSNDGLVALIETQTLQSMINQIDMATNFKESSVFNSYILLLQTLSTHKKGLEYVFQEGLWKKIFFAISGLTVPAKYVEIQASQYIADLIYNFFENEMAHYCEPILEELFLKLNSIDNLVNSYQVNNISAYNVYLKTLILSLEKFVGSKYESVVCQQIVEKYSVYDAIVNIHKLSNVNPLLLKNYMTLHLLFDCYTIWRNSDIETILKSISHCLSMVNDTQSYKQINYLCAQAIKYANITNIQLAGNIKFEKELVIAQIIPLKKYMALLKCDQDKGESLFDENNCIIESKTIYNCCNSFDSMLNDVAVSSILNIIDVVPILKQESLDYLIHFLSTLTNQYLHPDNWNAQTLEQGLIYFKFLEVLPYVFICWTKVLEYKLSIENIVQNNLLIPLVQNHSLFFNKTCYNSNLLQNGLKLISTALNKRIYENVQCEENKKAFDELCTTFQNYLLDTRPEIRDSALQCISSIIVCANYNSGHFFINLLLEKNIPISVFNTFDNDSDPFVKATALECLEKMVSIPEIWEILYDSNLLNRCLYSMEYEPEGIVRRQVVKLITAVFNYNEIPEMFKIICRSMVHISIKDLLWEVKMFAYEFWDAIVQKLVINLSIQDDTVQIYDSLINLSETGCLHVLYIALIEENDLAVQKKASCLTKKLLSYINSTNICISSMPEQVEKLVAVNDIDDCANVVDIDIFFEEDHERKRARHIDSSTHVIEVLSETKDCELLPELKNTERTYIYPEDWTFVWQYAHYISVKDFWLYINIYDFNECDEKTEWFKSTRSGLDSMLNDIIGYSTNCFVDGADLLDCY